VARCTPEASTATSTRSSSRAPHPFRPPFVAPFSYAYVICRTRTSRERPAEIPPRRSFPRPRGKARPCPPLARGSSAGRNPRHRGAVPHAGERHRMRESRHHRHGRGGSRRPSSRGDRLEGVASLQERRPVRWLVAGFDGHLADPDAPARLATRLRFASPIGGHLRSQLYVVGFSPQRLDPVGSQHFLRLLGLVDPQNHDGIVADPA
jgi:hypothetical protein